MSLIERSFRERIILVGVTIPPATSSETDEHLDELALLVDTAGADVVGRVLQRRERPDPATFVGKGKVEELRELSLEVDSDTVVFDDDLSPAQQRNLERLLGRTAISRTEVILDIFAQNARTTEGRAQVELAQLRHRLPRLRGRGIQLSRQAGTGGASGGAPMGSRGPGETQLEVDRRRLLRRMTKLEQELRSVTATRRTQRKTRAQAGNRTVSIVGYTNAGKSTLLNQLTDAGVLVEDRLFATLDPKVRRLDLPGGFGAGRGSVADWSKNPDASQRAIVETFKEACTVAESFGERLAAEGEICWGGMHSWKKMIDLLERVNRPHTLGFQADMAHTLLYILGYNAPEDALVPADYDWSDPHVLDHAMKTLTNSLRPWTIDFHVAQNDATVKGSGSHDKTGHHCLPNDPEGKLRIAHHAGYWLHGEDGKLTQSIAHICWDGCMFPNAVMRKQETWNDILHTMIAVRDAHGWRDDEEELLTEARPLAPIEIDRSEPRKAAKKEKPKAGVRSARPEPKSSLKAKTKKQAAPKRAAAKKSPSKKKISSKPPAVNKLRKQKKRPMATKAKAKSSKSAKKPAKSAAKKKSSGRK